MRHAISAAMLAALNLFMLFPPAYLQAQDNGGQKKHRIYKVWIWQETGDCLWNIAKKYYGNPRKWIIIYEANRDRIKNPDKIYPKQKLVIPFIVDEGISTK